VIAEITGRHWIWTFPENTIIEAFVSKKLKISMTLQLLTIK